VKVREGGRIVSVSLIVAVAVNTDGRCEVLGMDIGPSEAIRRANDSLDHSLARLTLLDGLPAQAGPARPARSEARRLGRP
jgi:hypothetical protein